MLNSIHIENYKSIDTLDLELGRINVFIGENGCGKTNILEAIALASAAADMKLGNEYFANRGIRVVEPKWMKNGFERGNEKKILLKTTIGLGPVPVIKTFSLDYTDEIYPKWFEIEHDADFQAEDENINKEVLDSLSPYTFIINGEKTSKGRFESKIAEAAFRYTYFTHLISFLIYSPENHFLRNFSGEAQIDPLGIRGEGLFKLLTVIAKEKPEQLLEIKDALRLIDWFDDLEIPNDLQFTERRLKIKDRFLADGLDFFDQRSSNEGFLYLLFYTTLFVSDYTPHFFAIDNIDNALNPKLCTELVGVLAKLAEKHNKQAIFTTHNPAILDGLDLNDDQQRLFVISRNKKGHTKALRIKDKPPVEGGKSVKLSEQFLRGYIGGLPKNF